MLGIPTYPEGKPEPALQDPDLRRHGWRHHRTCRWHLRPDLPVLTAPEIMAALDRRAMPIKRRNILRLGRRNHLLRHRHLLPPDPPPNQTQHQQQEENRTHLRLPARPPNHRVLHHANDPDHRHRKHGEFDHAGPVGRH